MGERAFKNNRMNRAEKYFKASLINGGPSVECFYLLGCASFRKGETLLAAERFKEAFYLNPDTFEIMEMDLPDTLNPDDEGIYGVHLDFVRECYPGGEVSDTISERDRYRIKNILKEVAYAQFMDCQQQETREEQGE